MAHPITFKPAAVDYHQELMHRVNAAPKEHAEALLVLWDLLQTSHDQGILELAQGMIGGKDIITGKLAEAANLPESIAAIRNGMALARVLGTIDPDMLHRLSKALDDQAKHKLKAEQQRAMHGGPKPAEEKVPSLWQLGKKVMSKDARRGIAFATDLLLALGRATKPE
jgi:uncharacterized protein YjgD (DUF1641 family)